MAAKCQANKVQKLKVIHCCCNRDKYTWALKKSFIYATFSVVITTEVRSRRHRESNIEDFAAFFINQIPLLLQS